MANVKTSTASDTDEYPYEEVTEELVILEAAWYADYSSPPKVDRIWVEEGEDYTTYPSNAQILLQQGLAIPKGKRPPKVPEDLNWSMAAFNRAKQSNLDIEKYEFIGTGELGKVRLDDVLRVIKNIQTVSFQVVSSKN